MVHIDVNAMHVQV